MAVTENSRSIYLANANPRLLTTPNTDIILTQSSELFKVNLAGNPDVSQITFNVISIAMEGGQNYQFSCVGGTLSSIAGNTAALQFSSMTADTATITVTVTYRNKTYTQTAKVSKLYEAESGTQGLNNTTVFAYQRSATALTSNPGAVTYSFTARGITNGTLANGWSKTIPAGTNPLYVTVATASSVTATDDIAANEWTAPVLFVSNGLDGVSPALMNLTANAQAFTYNSTSVATPANQTITFNAELINTTGTATFTCTKYDSTGASLGTVTLGGTGNTRTLTDAQFTTGAFRAVVTATLGTLTDTITIVRLADGANGSGVSALAGYLTNESVTVPSASDGSAPVLTNAKGNFKVFQGTTDVTANCTFSVVGSTAVNTVAPTSGTGAYSVTGIGTWASSSMTTSVTYRATHTPSGATIDQVFILTKAPAGLQGNAGINNAPITIYRRTTTNTAPALPNAAATYTFNPAGITGLTDGWTSTVSALSNGSYLWVSTATAASTSNTDSIPASEWAAAQVLVQPAAPGQRGTVQVARAVTGSVWSDSEALLALSGAGYGTPIVRDVVTLYNNASGFSQAKYYDGAAWQILAAYFNGGLIVDGTVYANALAANSVTAGKIAAGSVTAGVIDSRGLSIKDDLGNIIFNAGKTLAQQAASNPNLVPGPRGWPTFYGGGYSGRNGNPVFGDGAFLGLPGASTAGSYIAAESPSCGIPAGSWVTVSFDASCDTSGTRVLSLNFFGPNVDTAAFQPTVNTTFTRYVWTIQIPNVADAPNARLRVWSTAVGNQIIISNLKVELGNKATPWSDNVVTADNAKNRVIIPNLSTMSAYVGSIEIGPGGHIRQGMTDYSDGVGMWMGQHNSINKFSVGNPNGAMMWWDGNTLQTKGMGVTDAVYTPFSVSIDDVNGGSTSKVFTVGTVTAAITNPGNFKSILWTIDGAGLSLVNATSTTVTVRSSVGTSPATNTGILKAVVLGLDGRSVSDESNVTAEHA